MIKDEIKNMKNEVIKMKTEVNEETTFAMSLMKELKVSAKRWFTISIVLLIMLFASNIGWLIYNSQFETIETSTIELLQEEVNYSSQSGVIN